MGELMRTNTGRYARDSGKVAEIVTGVSSALDYAHQQGMLHRDVKPPTSCGRVPGGQAAGCAGGFQDCPQAKIPMG